MARTSNRKSVERSAPGPASGPGRKTRGGRETTPTQAESKKGRGKIAAHPNELGAIAEATNDQDGPEPSQQQIAQEMAQYASRVMQDPVGEVILDNLPMTYGTASGILDELARAPEDLTKVFKLDSNLDTKLKYTSPALSHEVGRILHSGNDGYLDTVYMKQAIFKDSPPTEPAESILEGISNRINLALFAAHLWTWNGDEIAFTSGIAVVDNRFPDQFLSHFFNGQNQLWASKLINETLELALSIRTQAAIAAFNQGEVSNPAELFYSTNERGETEARGFGRDFANVLWATQETEVLKRAEHIQEIWKIHDENAEATARALLDEFPVTKFVIEGLNWVRRRANEIKFGVQSIGGIDVALQAIKNNHSDVLLVPSGFNAPQAGAQKEVFTQSGFPSSIIPTSQLSQDHGFSNSVQASPTPRKAGKRKANPNQNGGHVPETKKQKVQRENPIDVEAFDARVMAMSQAAAEPSQTFTPTPAAPAAPKEPKIQSRIKWTPDEVNALIQYIELFGPHWSKIKDVDNDRYLEKRDQVALKDKARNLKFECLKQGKPMYTNFESVTLSQSMRAKLMNMGHPVTATQTVADTQPTEAEHQNLLPGVAEYNNANDDAAASQGDENAFEDAPEAPSQEDMPVDPELSRSG